MARKLGAAIRPWKEGVSCEGNTILVGEVEISGWNAEWWQTPPHFFDRREVESLLEPARFKNAAFYGL